MVGVSHVLGALRAPFWNGSEGRIRAFWRVLLAVLVALVGAAAAASVGTDLLSPPAFTAVVSVVMAAVALCVVVVWARYVARRSLADYGFDLDRTWWLDLAGGLAIGTAVHLGAFLTYLATGWAHVAETASPGASEWGFPVSFAVVAVTYTAVAVWEESIFRGVFVVDGAEGLGWLSPRSAVAAAGVVAAAVFGLLHFQQATTAVSFLFWVSLGVVLVAAFALTGRLGLPIGIHLAYNLAGNAVFGITSVRTEESPTLVRLAFTGPDAFVQLAGVVNGAFVVVGAVLTLAWVRWRTGELAIRAELATWDR